MTTTRSDIVSDMQLVISAMRSGRAFDGEVQSATSAIIDWLAARVPYKQPLPRGYSVLWQVKNGADGEPRQFHQLLKSASAAPNGQGVWIDTSALRDTDIRDVRAFANDLASGLLAEIVTFLQQTSPAN
jgi:hypothetical protein